MEAFLKVIGHEFCDITLMLDGTPIHAHKVVIQRNTSDFFTTFADPHAMPLPRVSSVGVCRISRLCWRRGAATLRRCSDRLCRRTASST